MGQTDVPQGYSVAGSQGRVTGVASSKACGCRERQYCLSGLCHPFSTHRALWS